MKVIRLGFLVCLLLSTSRFLYADKLKDNFQANLNQDSIDALTKDIGAMVGGGSFHQGKPLGFPLGFDVGVHATAIGVKDSDPILHSVESTWGAVFGQVEVGLPARLGVIGRAGTLGSGTVFGGGLKYGLLDSSVPGVPQITIQGLYDRMSHDFFDMTHYSVDAVLSFDIPIIRPYIGGGWDKTKLDLKDAAFVGVPASVPRSLDGSASGYRAEAGINLSLIPFTYITLGAGVANGGPLYHLGLGAMF